MRHRKTKEIKKEERVSTGRRAADSKACEPTGSEKVSDGKMHDDDDDDDGDGARFIGSASGLSPLSPFAVTHHSHLMYSSLSDRSSFRLTFCFNET